MKEIRYDDGFYAAYVKERRQGTAGVYGLVDPRDGRVRYVGSSLCIERRLYEHVHLSSGTKTPKGAWAKELRTDGVTPNALLLEAADPKEFGPVERHEAETRWIHDYGLVGDADLNVRLTPVGHANSKDSGGKKLRAEIRALREQVEKLKNENANLRNLLRFTQHECNTLPTR